MESKRRPRLLMLTFNEIIKDGRVIKTATSLAEESSVRVLGIDRGDKGLDRSQIKPTDYPFELRWVSYPWLGRIKRMPVTYGLMYVKMLGGMLWHAIWYQPDVIWAVGWFVLHPAKWIARLTRARLIYDSRELYREKRKAPGFAMALKNENWALKHADLVIACNHFRAQIMHKEYGARKLPTVIPNYVPFREYASDSTLRDFIRDRNPAVKTLVLYQGAIVHGRGLETIVQSLQHLPPSVGVVLVGFGERGFVDNLKQQVIEWKLQDRCVFYGSIPYLLLCRITPSVDLGIVTYLNINRNNYYCAPNKLYEYTLAGVPMLGADLPPIRDYFEKTQTGIIFDATSAQDLAAKIMQFVNHPEKLAQYHENALRVAPEYVWERNTPKLNQLVKEVLNNKPSKR